MTKKAKEQHSKHWSSPDTNVVYKIINEDSRGIKLCEPELVMQMNGSNFWYPVRGAVRATSEYQPALMKYYLENRNNASR